MDFSRSIGLTQPLSFVDTPALYFTDFNPNKRTLLWQELVN